MRIGIIGCGVAGQASAVAVARDGHDVTVFERIADPGPVGAGLLLQPSGLLALERLALREAVEAWGAPVSRLFGRTVRGRVVMELRYDDLDAGAGGLGIHRAALYSVLHEALRASGARLHLDFEVNEIENLQHPRLIGHSGASEGPFDLVLDCAGAHNALCGKMGWRSRDALYPWGALWTTCPDRNGQFQDTLRQVYDAAKLMIGILPVGHMPGAAFDGNHVAFFWSLRVDEFESQRDAGIDALKSRILAAWPVAAPIIDEIKSFDALSFATHRDARMRPSYRGRVLAMGDAAHATSPQLGQGANLALIDAVTLSHALKTSPDTDAALALYERLRRPHLRYYQMASRALTPAFQSDNRLLARTRDIFFGPLGRLPVSRHVMRTTLSGVRLFPWGRWRLPG